MFDGLLHDAAREVVDYMLFVDEAPLPGIIEGSRVLPSGFLNEGRATVEEGRCGSSI